MLWEAGFNRLATADGHEVKVSDDPGPGRGRGGYGLNAMMRKSTLNLIVDALALVVLAMLAATGFLIAYKLPPGSGGGEGRFGAVHGRDWPSGA